MTPHLKHPLRVPSVLPGLWVYLRTWMVWRQPGTASAGYRTHGNGLWQVAAVDVPHPTTPDIGGYIHRADGLLPVEFRHRGSFKKNAEAVDGYLFSLGAEVVPTGEWADGCVGAGFHPDRPPLTHEHWDALHAELKRRGCSGGMFHNGFMEVL